MEEGTGFQIPEPPRGPRGPRTQRLDPRGVSLPWGGKEAVMVIDIHDGSLIDSALSEGMMSLVQAFQTHRRAWLILE